MSEINKGGQNLSPEMQRQLTARTRRAFLTMGVGAAAGYGGWHWLGARPEGGLAQPLRRMLRFNERVASAYYDQSHRVPTFPSGRVQNMRLNGDIGLGDDFDPRSWQLIVRRAANEPSRRLTLADIQALPKVEHATQLKCIEGWSVIMHFVGARFSDFTAAFAPESARAPYVSMQTPDEQYFVGLDTPSALHPQTLLCYEMNGAPLTMEHGAPLRLAIPVKYGIKGIKRIGAITYTSQRPRDYWAEEGYDWYAGL